MPLTATEISKSGKYQIDLKVQEIKLLLGKYNYAAKVVKITEKSTGKDVTNRVGHVQEHHGVLAMEAVRKAVKEAQSALSGKGSQP